jgi:hypothetical protein
MGRRLSLLLLLGLFLAESAAAAGLSAGAVGGPVRSHLSGDAPARGSYRGAFGHQLGLAVDLVLTPHVVLTVQPGLLQRNVDLQIKRPTSGNPSAKDVFGIGIESVTVPLLAQYVFGTRRVRFLIQAGMEVRHTRDARLERPDGTETDITETIADTEAAFDLGLGIRFPTGRVRWSAEARFITGLSDLAEGDPLEGAAGENIVWKSRSTQLLASVTVPLF